MLFEARIQVARRQVRAADACREAASRTGIRKSAGYGGVRIDVQARLDGARRSLQVDIGFGDAVTPRPQAVRCPVLLDGLPASALLAYPKATVIAEKLRPHRGSRLARCPI